MRFTNDTYFRDIILEGDNVSVFSAFKANEDGFALGGAIVANVSRVNRFCKVLSFSFVKQYENYVAHALAKFTKTVNDFIIWLEDHHPLWIEESLLLI